MTSRFEEYCRRREALALGVRLPPYRTVRDDSASVSGLVAIESPWSNRLFDGPFYRSAPASPQRPAISLVFVQSREGNTVASEPSVLGGGAVDKHVIYEGLSRIDADAILSGATTARARNLVFSLWHPELVALRLARGLPRHPAQVIVTERGQLRFDDGLMFHEPELRVIVIAGSAGAAVARAHVKGRPWIEVVDAGQPLSLTRGVEALAERGLQVVSAVGGPRTATALIDERLVDDLYLTTSPLSAGEPNTPFYEGPPLSWRPIIEKAGTAVEEGVRFEHLRPR